LYLLEIKKKKKNKEKREGGREKIKSVIV